MIRGSIELNDLLTKQSIDLKRVLVFRHRPSEAGLRRVLPWLAAERPDVFNAYQQTQGPKVENALSGAEYVVSTIGHEAKRAAFVGLYKVGDHTPITYEEYWRTPAYIEMKSFGMKGFTGGRASCLWFDLERVDVWEEWSGRLVFEWPGLERSWWRWADRNRIPIHAILEESIFERGMPNWDMLVLTWPELAALPKSWRAALKQWRGIYYILDRSSGRGYVGAAYGRENLLGRWLNYALSGHGGNKHLKQCGAENLVFSILERVSPDMPVEEAIALEGKWKDRLHTREFGLNEN